MVEIADFRSDTMTAPTPEMRRAMAEAEVGDDVWGEDPSVRRLEQTAAELLGKPAAVFVPSGTMANQIAIHVHCRPGDELICEQRAHVFFYEGGAIARLSGTQVRTLVADDGFPTVDQVRDAIRPDDAHFPRSRLLVLENTHNMAGGRVADVARIEALARTAREHGLAVHVDGARLMNAAVALGVAARDLVAAADSSTLCLSKGLGAPVGSVLAGSEAFVAEARRARKAFGGGMRQAGVLAACGLLALQDVEARLRQDHERARQLATGLAALPWADCDVGATDSNIVMLRLAPGVDGAALGRLVTALAERDVRVAQAGADRLRFVLHRDLPSDAVSRCLDICGTFDCKPLR